MRPGSLAAAALSVLVLAACMPGWKVAGGSQKLPASSIYLAPEKGVSPALVAAAPSSSREEPPSRPVVFDVPAGWHWFDRGDDLIATKDGVFLQHLFIERIHINQTDQRVMGAFPFAAFSSKQWPVRTAKNMKKRFAAGMEPGEAAEVLLDSRRNDPSVTDLEVLKVVTRMVAGQQAFRAVFDFRLKREGREPFPRYRTIYCGFVLDEWFYGISYTAASRYYFDRDVDTFETFLQSIRLADR
jgi:hypothetical protein